MSEPIVSVVILTRNAGPHFARTLARVRAQALADHAVEIVAIDSGSTDGTPDVARGHGAEVIEIAAASFNHGETRNLGMDRARGELVAWLVQDASPADDDWLGALVRAVEGEPRAAGAYSRQLPWPDDDALSAFLVHQWHRLQGGKRMVQSLPARGGLRSLPYAERRRVAGFDNVSSLVRREDWERHPFRPVRFAEDVDWAKRVLEDGRRLIYEPASRVYHAHRRPFAYNARRQYVDERVLFDVLEADDSLVRSWGPTLGSIRLVWVVLAAARREGRLSPGLVARTVSFASATAVGAFARRVSHPALRRESPPGWALAVDRWLSAGL